MRSIAVTILLVLASALLLLTLALLAGVRLVVALGRRVLADRVTRRGNQLYRLGQRVRDADERISAALGIVTERRGRW